MRDIDLSEDQHAVLRLHNRIYEAQIRVGCHLYADHEEHQREIEQFWLTTLDLPESSLCKSIVNVYSKYSKRKRVGMLPYGTCRVVVSRTSVVQGIYGAIQEIAGFERDAWRDAPS